MENERNELPQNEDWLEGVLPTPEQSAELGPDEDAVSAVGLIHPDDMELERILAEHRETGEDQMSIPLPEEIPAEPAFPDDTMMIPEEFFNIPRQATPEEAIVIPAVPSDEAAPVTEETQFFDPVQEEFPPKPAQEEDTPLAKERIQPERKGRPKRKKGYGLLGIPHLLATLVWLAIIVAVGVSLGRTLWLCCADLMAFDKEPSQATIIINDNDDIESISQKLGTLGLIRYPKLFQIFAEITGKDERISTGTFTLSSKLDYNAMINNMTYYGASREEVDIMFPEGYTCAQIFALLEENGVCTVAELEEYAANGELSYYWFLEGVERGDRYCLEGYLFPDTYTFYTDDEPGRVLEKFLSAFDARFTDLMRERLIEINTRYAQMLASEGYGQDYIDEHPITIREAVIIASLIEKEAADNDEGYTISSVIYNRLSDSSQPPYLGFDSALVYALGKSELSAEDIELDNPYNLRKYTGLPPTPIANPGQESLNAALVPEDTSYYYFCLNPETGKHEFFKTYAEHQAFAAKLED